LKIGVTFAMTSEFAPWRRRRRFERVTDSQTPMYRTQDGHNEIYALITGVGTHGMQIGLRPLFDHDIEVCIVSGLAGALKPEYRVGEVLVANAVRRESDGSPVRSDTALVDTAARCGARVADFFCTVTSVIGSSSGKQRLGNIGNAVDMESFQLMSETVRAGIPTVAVRAISDPMQASLPLDFNRMLDDRGQLRTAALLLELARTPRKVPAFARFGWEGLSAARHLTAFLDQYVKALALEESLVR
jgi:nucleoside phosphorylase